MIQIGAGLARSCAQPRMKLEAYGWATSVFPYLNGLALYNFDTIY